MNQAKKPAVILLGHGSRVRNAGEDMEKVAHVLRETYGYPRVEYCFMSRLGPHFPATLGKLVAAGEEEILVIPYFLHSGLHIVLDIPEMMKREAGKYPDIRLRLGGNLGFDDILAELVHKRITESLSACDVRDLELPRREQFPIPPGQHEFVPMLPEEAAEYIEKHGHGHDHDH
jgi:sirohydrochlorin ferrochelatase